MLPEPSKEPSPGKRGTTLGQKKVSEKRLCATKLLPNFWRGKTRWVDSSCADCPGFPVLGAGDAPPPELHPGASECAPGLAFAFKALRANSWICRPQLPYHPSKTGRTAHVFAAQGVTHRVFWHDLPLTPK